MDLRDKINKLLSHTFINRIIVFCADCLTSVSATFISIYVVLSLVSIELSGMKVAAVLMVSAVSTIISILLFRTYAGVIRHSNILDIGRIARLVWIKAFFVSVSLFIFADDLWGLKTLLGSAILDFLLTFFMLVLLRIIFVEFYNYLTNKPDDSDVENILIYGSKEKTASIINTSFNYLKGNYRIIGAIDYGRHHQLRIANQNVFFVRDFQSFEELVVKRAIHSILFPDKESINLERDRIVRYCERKKVKMVIFPELDTAPVGKIQLRALPKVEITDLLGRKEIHIDMNPIIQMVAGKRILVTGAAGSIGSELCRQLARLGVDQLIAIDSAETPMHNLQLEFRERFESANFHCVMGDVRLEKRMDSIFARFQPHIVYHAAAYKHVPLMEDNPCESVLTNAFGTKNVADLAVKYKVERFVMVSTDKAVNPTNVMGASKRLAEIYTQSLGHQLTTNEETIKTKFITTRFGNVLGSNGSVIPHFQEQLMRGGPLTVTHPDIIRYFMTIPEACRLVLTASTLGNSNEIFIFDMGTPVRIADMARRMIELAGLIPDIDIEITYTGLRPGEKLFEELLNNKENTIPTHHEKIFRAKARKYNYEEVRKAMEKLYVSTTNVQKVETVKQLKKLIPEFISQQSIYEELDNKEK